jgi:hypothetical protein
MIKNKLLIILLLISLISCADFFEKTSNISENKVSLDSINFNLIDAYPLLPECENLDSRAKQKACFYFQLSNKIKSSLIKNSFQLPNTVQDTVLVKILVNSKGNISVSSIFLSDEIKENIPVLDSLIKHSVSQIQQMQPAIKSGIPITSEFTLPIVISAE